MAKAYKANYHAAVIMEQGMWVYALAAIMACTGLKLRVTQREREKVVGGIKKNYHSVEKSSCSYIVWYTFKCKTASFDKRSLSCRISGAKGSIPVASFRVAG